MTILSINIRTLRKKYKYTQDTLGSTCDVSGAAVSQWEAKNKPTMPDIDHLLTMSGLFKVTVEQLVHSSDVENDISLSLEMNNITLEKVFIMLDQNPLVDKSFNTASIKKKTYMFGLLYALCEDMDGSELAGTTELIDMMGLSSRDISVNESAEEKSTFVTKKHRRHHQ